MNGTLVWLAEGIEVASENPVENLVLRGTREPYPFWNIVLNYKLYYIISFSSLSNLIKWIKG